MIEFRVVPDEYREQVSTSGRGRYGPLLKELDRGATVLIPAAPNTEEGRLIRNRLANAASMRGMRFRYGVAPTDADETAMVVWFEERSR